MLVIFLKPATTGTPKLMFGTNVHYVNMKHIAVIFDF